jgi:hypothetical protein
MRLTISSIRPLALPEGKQERTFFDDDLPGFGVRVRAGGSRTYVVQYKLGSKHRWITLGAVNSLDLSKARATAKSLLAVVRLGRDPASEKQAAKAKTDETFGAMLPRYLAHKRAKLKPRSFEEVDRHLTINCRSLHARPIDAVDQRAAAILLAKTSEDRGPKACNNTRASGSGYYSWLMREGLASNNPFANTNKAVENAPRERTPSDDELAEIWRACPNNQYGTIVKLLMLFAGRRDEVAGLRWSEIDLDAALITLPAARVKGGREHENPLSAEGIKDGYLSPLRSKATNTRIDVRGVHIRGGEFIPSELERAANVVDVVEDAVAEIITWGKDRRAWICFCTGVAHAYAVRDEIRRQGISCETVTAETPGGEATPASPAAGRLRAFRCRSNDTAAADPDG